MVLVTRKTSVGDDNNTIFSLTAVQFYFYCRKIVSNESTASQITLLQSESLEYLSTPEKQGSLPSFTPNSWQVICFKEYFSRKRLNTVFQNNHCTIYSINILLIEYFIRRSFNVYQFTNHSFAYNFPNKKKNNIFSVFKLLIKSNLKLFMNS